MTTAQRMADEIRLEGKGVFALLWSSKDDLRRALLVLDAALPDLPQEWLLLGHEGGSITALRRLIDTRVSIVAEDEKAHREIPRVLWVLFVQQASSEEVGPRLNGWRNALREAPGTILVIRYADFEPFQRSAPDLASFVGPRIHNAASFLSVVSPATRVRLAKKALPEREGILAALPGEDADPAELQGWIDDGLIVEE